MLFYRGISCGWDPDRSLFTSGSQPRDGGSSMDCGPRLSGAILIGMMFVWHQLDTFANPTQAVSIQTWPGTVKNYTKQSYRSS